MGKKLRSKLRISGRGMVTKKVLRNGKISVWETQSIVFNVFGVNFNLQKTCMFTSSGLGGLNFVKARWGNSTSIDSIVFFFL